MVTTLLAFVVTLGILIAVHEYGHYRVAVACGIKVLKFSIGFGKPLFTWRLKGNPCEFSIGFLPLGGYVKLLDEREAPVDASERHLAFNTQPLASRAMVVAAGPAANLLLAILIYAVVNWVGVQEPKAILGAPVASSLAEKAGLVGGETVLQAALGNSEMTEVRSFEDFRWRMTRGALNGQDLHMLVSLPAAGSAASVQERTVVLPLGSIVAAEADATLFRKIGLVGPWTRPVMGDVMPGGAAEKAGLKSGDVVERVGLTRVMDGQQLRELIRTSARDTTSQAAGQTWAIQRGTQQVSLQVTPEVKSENGVAVARVGAYIGNPPEFVTVRYGPVEEIGRAHV